MYCLHGFIDDATHQITGLYLSENECMQGYLEVTRQTLKNFGIPLALYADGSSIFFPKDKELTIEEQLAGITKPSTQYGRMMNELNVNDRLKTEFRVNKITTLEEANKFLIKYIPKFNKKFGIEAENKKSSFLKLPKYVNLDYILSVKYTRTVDVSNCISISGTTFLIETKEILHKKKVEICISKRIGMKVRFNDKWYKIIPIYIQNKKSLKSNDSVEAIIQNFVYLNYLKNERLSA